VKVNDFLITLVRIWTKEEKVQSYTDNSFSLSLFIHTFIHRVYLEFDIKKNRKKKEVLHSLLSLHCRSKGKNMRRTAKKNRQEKE